jgi:large subunit ribosomal protein L3
VIKGKKLPGRMGGKRHTVLNQEIVKVDSERNLLFIKGSVPGAKNSYVLIRK